MIFAITAVICLFAVLIMIFLYIFPMFFMHPLASGTLEGTDIIAIRNRINNLFFIPAGKDWIVIDAGSDAKPVKQKMAQLSIDGQRVKAVFLTHTDYDYVASLILFPNATIYMSDQEEKMIDGSTNRQFVKKNKLPKLSTVNKIIYLADNEIINFCSHRIRIIWAPGHTKGSALYALDEKFLFSGDAFKIVDGRILIHPYSMDKNRAQKTIYTIQNEWMHYEKVFTAHYGMMDMRKTV